MNDKDSLRGCEFAWSAPIRTPDKKIINEQPVRIQILEQFYFSSIHGNRVGKTLISRIIQPNNPPKAGQHSLGGQMSYSHVQMEVSSIIQTIQRLAYSDQGDMMATSGKKLRCMHTKFYDQSSLASSLRPCIDSMVSSCCWLTFGRPAGSPGLSAPCMSSASKPACMMI